MPVFQGPVEALPVAEEIPVLDRSVPKGAPGVSPRKVAEEIPILDIVEDVPDPLPPKPNASVKEASRDAKAPQGRHDQPVAGRSPPPARAVPRVEPEPVAPPAGPKPRVGDQPRPASVPQTPVSKKPAVKKQAASPQQPARPPKQLSDPKMTAPAPQPRPVPLPPQPRAVWPWVLCGVLFLAVGSGLGYAISLYVQRPQPHREVSSVTQPTNPTNPTPPTNPTNPTEPKRPDTNNKIILPSDATVVTVAKSGGDYTRIGDALKSVRPDMVIKIKPGTYDESLTLPSAVTLEGDGERNQITIRGLKAPAVTIESPRALVRNLCLRSEGKGFPAVLLVADGSLRDCVIHSEAVACVVVEGGTPTLTNCTLHGGPLGLQVLAGAPNLTECKVLQQKGVGIDIQKNGQVNLVHCTITECEQGGILIQGGRVDMEKDCVVSQNGDTGIWIEGGGQVHVKGGAIRDNKGWGIRARTGARFELENCKVTDNVRGKWECDGDCKNCKVDGQTVPVP